MLRKIPEYNINPIGGTTFGPGDLVRPLFTNELGLVVSLSHRDSNETDWYDVLLPDPPVAERFRISSSGGIGIGTRAPSTPIRYDT
jgi:hypothetical protein